MKIFTSIVIGICFFISAPTVFAVARVSVSPSAVTLAEEGANQTFSITLDEPIITMEEEGYVTIALSVDDSRVVLSAPSVTFAASEWFQTKTFTVETVGDAVQNADNTVTISMLTVSNSEYYNNFQNSIAITLTDDDVAQTHTANRSRARNFGCKDPNALNYNYFSTSKPSLCKYASTQLVPNATTPTSTGTNIPVSIFTNMQPDMIRALQAFLIAQAKGEAAILLAQYGTTGYFGTITQNALLEWQRSE